MKLRKPKRKKNKRAIRVRPIICIRENEKDREQENLYKKIIADHGSNLSVINNTKKCAHEKDMDDFLTSNFYERGEKVTAEQKLFYSVLTLGLKDYKRGCGLAYAWVWNNNYEIGDFVWLCHALNTCPYKLRGLIREEKILSLDKLSNITWTIRSNTLSKAYERERRKKLRQQKKKMTT